MKILQDISDLFTNYGIDQYIGEPLSILEHSLQCAQQAFDHNAEPGIVVGAFLHDIGHLLGKAKGLQSMTGSIGTLGAANHDQLGAEWLKDHAFPELTVFIVQQHVNAKRYLCAVDKYYYKKLSEASKQTLICQGGPMSEPEVIEFEKHAHHKSALLMRTWDENAKIANYKTDFDLPKMLKYIENMMEQM